MDKTKIYKINTRLYPIYRMLSFDFLFFYTINILFLTEIKGIAPSNILLIDAFYSLFTIIFQVPSSLILDRLGKKKSIILGNIFNFLYLIIIILSQNLIHLILAEIFCSFGYALKDTASPSLLNESIPPTKYKSNIFAKINAHSLSGYYILNAISLIISGFLYNINGYLPIILSICVVFISTVLSFLLIEPIDKNVTKNSDIINLNESFKFIFSSGRLKSLILYSSIMTAFIYILSSSEIYLLQELNISSSIIGITFAFLGILSGTVAKKQKNFQEIFKNKTLSVLAIAIAISIIVASLTLILKLPTILAFVIILISLSVKHAVVGLYYVFIAKYLSNFTNEQIDSKIFTAQLFFDSIASAILGTIASAVLDKFGTSISILIFGITFLILFILTIFYMKNKLGLQPSEYSENEKKFDTQN